MGAVAELSLPGEPPMPSPVLKFIHASDFHLERQIHGISEIPRHLRDALVDAPYRAVEGVFAAALVEEVEFVVLSGDILAVDEMGPRSLLFLVEQFERLADRGIPVYWAVGRIDPPARWQLASLLPENIHRFPGSTRQFLHRRDNAASVRLLGSTDSGRSMVRAVDYQRPDDDLFTIALGYGACDPVALSQTGVDYWALGGQHQRQCVQRTPSIHYPGTPQGRCPNESGPHGCTLVEVNAEGDISTSPLVTDAIRWQSEEVAVDSSATLSTLEQSLADHLQRHNVNAGSRQLLLSWQVIGSGPLIEILQSEAKAEELLAKLRVTADNKPAGAWSLSLEAGTAMSYSDAWYEEESMLGEFLRNVRDLQADASRPLEVEPQLPAGELADRVAGMVTFSGPEDRARTLRRAADLGVRMLSGADSGEP